MSVLRKVMIGAAVLSAGWAPVGTSALKPMFGFGGKSKPAKEGKAQAEPKPKEEKFEPITRTRKVKNILRRCVGMQPKLPRTNADPNQGTELGSVNHDLWYSKMALEQAKEKNRKIQQELDEINGVAQQAINKQQKINAALARPILASDYITGPRDTAPRARRNRAPVARKVSYGKDAVELGAVTRRS